MEIRMAFSRITISLACSAALALAACSDTEAEVDETDAVTPAAQTAEYDPMTRDYTLNEEAQTRRADFDVDAMQTNYGAYRGEIMSERVRMGNNRDAEAEMSDDDREEMTAAAQARDAATNMRTRANMTWGYLDRDDDDKLSVAEYAIWAIPLDPTAPKRDDETAPYLTADQANKAADSFFYYDIDGDTYLSRREFTAARRGETIGG
jgi:hypothetical protein